MQALTFLSSAGRVDLQRVLVLRAVSNYDREAPGVPVAESLQEMVSGNYSAYMPALRSGANRRRQSSAGSRGALGRTGIQHSSHSVVTLWS